MVIFRQHLAGAGGRMGNRWFLGTFTEQLLDPGGCLMPKPVNEKSRH